MSFTRLEPTGVNTSATFTFAEANVTANLTVGGKSNLGPASNVVITGGSSGQVLTTDGSGGLSWATGGGGSATAAGSNTQVQFNDNNNLGASANFVFNKTSNTLTVTNYAGNGAGLTSLAGANVTGTVANATYATSAGSATTAGTVTTAAQPNITSVGTLTSLGVNGTITAVAITANTGVITGNGSGLSAIAGANVTGTVANATYATSAGSSTTAGTVTTAAQPNITSVGTLSSLAVTANANVGNLNASSNITANGVQITGSSGDEGGEMLLAKAQTNTSIAGTGVTIDIYQNKLRIFEQGGTVRGGYFDITALAAGVGTDLAAGGGGTPGGSNTYVQFNDNGSFGGTANMVFNKTSNTLTVTNIAGNGSGLTSITGGNVTGTVANATYATSAGSATTAGTVTTAAQPNITSVGTLSSLGVTANITAGNVAGGNLVSANYFSGNGSLFTSITGANVTGTVANATYATSAGSATTATTAGTVTTAAQPNITSVGTLSSVVVTANANVGNLNASGSVIGVDATFSGNLTVSGTTEYTNVTNLYVKDPIIEQGGGANGAALTTNDNKDRGSLLHYYTTTPVDAFMGWDNSNSEFGFGSNVSVTSEVVTWNTYGNVRAGNFIGTLSGAATTAGTVTTATQPNITSTGTLSSLTVSGLITATGTGIKTSNIVDSSGTTTISVGYSSVAGAVGITGNLTVGTGGSGNITASNANLGNLVTANYHSGNGSLLTSLTGGNVTGQVGNALIAGTVYTNAQPNITSVGSLTGLTVSNASGVVNLITTANVSLGAVGNLHITGGTTGQYLQTDGSGTLSWATVSGGSANVNVTAQTSGTFYPVFVNGNTTSNFALGSNANLSFNAATGQLNVTSISSGSGAGGNITGANLISANYFSGTNLTITGTASFGNTLTIQQTTEVVAAPTSLTYNYLNGGVFYVSGSTGSFLPNFTNIPTTDNRVTVISIIITQSGTAYYPSGCQIDGTTQTVKWPGGTAPTGTVSSLEVFSFSLLRTGAAWIVSASSSSYK